MDNTQPQIFFVSIEVAIVMQKLMIVFNAKSGNETVHCLADSDSFLPQEAITSCAFHRQHRVDHAFLHKFPQYSVDFLKIGVVTKALQYFCQNQVAAEDWVVFQCKV